MADIEKRRFVRCLPVAIGALAIAILVWGFLNRGGARGNVLMVLSVVVVAMFTGALLTTWYIHWPKITFKSEESAYNVGFEFGSTRKALKMAVNDAACRRYFEAIHPT